MQNIEIEKYGLIKKGKNIGWYVYIQHDDPHYYILLLSSLDRHNRQGFDSWIEKYEHLAEYFSEVGWDVEWLDLNIPPPYIAEGNI